MTIQNEPEEKKILEKIVAASEEFLQSDGNKINYQEITDTIADISGAKYAVFSLYDEGGNKFITTAISAPEGIIKKVSSLLGFKLPGKKWDYDQVRAWKTMSSTITHFPSLIELTGDTIPKPVIYLLEKTFNVGEVVFIKISKENTMIGDITLIMPKNVMLKNDNYIELYSRQLGLLITRKRAEEALRESEGKFRDLAQMLPETVFEINMQGALTFVNQRTFEVFGYTRQDLDRGINALDMLIPGDRERGQKEIANSFRGVNKGPHEYIAQRNDGSTFPILISSSPIIRDGKAVGLRGLIFDITGRKRAEEALQESKKTIERYLNIVAEIIISLDNLGNITMINESGHQLLGYNHDELVGRNWFKTCLPDEIRNDVMNDFEKIMNGDIANVINYENVVKTKSGETRTIFWHNTILKDSNGNITGTISSGEDITERKKAEALLHIERERLANILEGTNAGTWEWNIQTNKTVYNERWAEIIGYTLAEISPVSEETWERFTHPDDIEKSNEQLKKVFSGEINYYDVECRMKHKDGSWVWVQDRGKVMSWTPDGKPIWMSGTHTDITERKLSEEALKASEEKFSKAFETSNYAIGITRLQDGKFIEINEAFTNITGFTREEACADSSINLKLWVSMENRDRVVAMLKEGIGVKNKEFEFRKKNGEVMIGLFSAQTVYINNEPFIFTSISDITDRKIAEAEILHLSFHDHLTGLYNRRFFEEELKRLDTKRQLPLSFLMGDLNSLKLINDVFGHIKGDDLLKETSKILKRVCRSDDILARWGGDEFVLLLPKTSISEAEDLVERIKKECKKTVSHKVPVSLSLGVAAKEEADQDIQLIVTDAESNMYKNKLAQKNSLTSSIIFALEQALYEKSNETKEHTDRMQELARKLGKSARLSVSQLDELSLLASLHDIGKVAIPEKILLKKGKLTDKEWDIIKRHPEIGFNIAQSSPQISHIAKAILCCHENWDGSGYPAGLKGESIPIISRIILIVDAYDVMANGRVYEDAISSVDAIGEIKRCAGTQFDPTLVDAFIKILAD